MHFYWYQIFALDSAVVEVQEMFSSHGGHLTNAMYHHGKACMQLPLVSFFTIIKVHMPTVQFAEVPNKSSISDILLCVYYNGYIIL